MNQELTSFHKTVVGVQFLFVAFGALVLMPLLVGLDPSTAMLSAGVGTLIFHVVTKGKVPVFLGSNFAYVAPILLSAKLWGFPGVFTGFLGVAVVYFAVAALVRLYGTAFLDRIFPPVVIGPTIMLIGLSLAPTAVDMAKKNWLLAVIALAVSVAVLMWAKGLLNLLPIVTGVAAGYAAALCLGQVDLTPLKEAPWFALPASVAHPRLPILSWQPFFVMMPIALASIIEHVGDVYVISHVAEKDFVHDPGLHRTILGDGLAILFGAFAGGPPVTTYSEVTGAIQITKVTDPKVLRITAAAAILFSVLGKMNAFLQTIPPAVLGGIMMMLFGTIASVGVQSMTRHKVNFAATRNTVIIALMLSIGVGGAVFTVGSFSLSSIGLAAIVGVILNLILPGRHDK